MSIHGLTVSVLVLVTLVNILYTIKQGECGSGKGINSLPIIDKTLLL